MFPPYFVAGAIYSGFAMVLTLAIPIRKAYHMEDLITIRHLDNCTKLMLVTGMIVAFSYFNEFFLGWYGGDKYEMYMLFNRSAGPYWPAWWLTFFCNVVVIQLAWFPKVRKNPLLLWIISIFVNIGMWTERFVIVVTSLHRDFMPSSWDMYYPSIWDWATLLGSMGLFAMLFFLFVRFLPMMAMSEVKETAKEEGKLKHP